MKSNKVAINALITALRDPDTTVRVYAAAGLQNKIFAYRAVPALIQVRLQDSEIAVRYHASLALLIVVLWLLGIGLLGYGSFRLVKAVVLNGRALG